MKKLQMISRDNIVNKVMTVLIMAELLVVSGCVSDTVLDRKISQYRPDVV